MTADPHDPMIGRVIGPYRILEEIDRGRWGIVYRARHEVLGKDVAIKSLPPHAHENQEELAHLKHEAQALARLNHPAIVVIHDFIPADEPNCIVMELVEGETLLQLLKRGALAEREALRLGLQLAQGLAAAHSAGVIHRDLKPDNLCVTPDGRLKILDFGLARLLPRSTGAEKVTGDDPEGVRGTLQFVPPEVLRGEPATAASDQYAAGIILYQMATGVHPFPDLDGRDIAHATMYVDPLAPRARKPKISVGFDALISRCMEKSPGRRFASCQEMARALGELLARPSLMARVLQRVLRRMLGLVQRHGRRIVIGGAVMLTAAVAAIYIYDRWRQGLPIRSLAVLPFVNLTGDPAQEYFADGVTDDLISLLMEHDSLRVISRTTAMRYRDTGLPLLQIANELRVQGIVEGSVAATEDGVKLRATLIQVGGQEKKIWSDEHEGPRRKVHDFTIQAARSILRKIGLKRPDLLGSQRPVDPAALELYKLGRFHWSRRDVEGVRRAIAYFTSAIGRDSLYAQAYSGLADAWTTAGHLGVDPPVVAYPRAKEAALKALALDSTMSDGYVSLANFHQNFEWDWEGAAAYFRRAIELNANNAIAHHWYSNLLARRGEFEEALAEIRIARDLDPYSLPILIGTGACLYFAREYEGALQAYREAALIDSTSGLLHRARAGTLYQLGRGAETADAIQRWLETTGQPQEARTRTRAAYRTGGLAGMARVLIGDLERQRQSGKPVPGSYLAELAIVAGDHEAAIRWLETAFREHDTELNRLKVDPLFDPLRGDRRFQSLLHSVGLGPEPPGPQTRSGSPTVGTDRPATLRTIAPGDRTGALRGTGG